MNDFVIFTDSACDLTPDYLNELGVKFIDMSFKFEDDDKEYLNSGVNISDFYNKMKDGAVAKTAAINPDGFGRAFEESLKEGKDILYLAFSSGLSTTYNSSSIAAEELLEKYPERKIITVDTLCASAGEGLIVCLAAEKKKDGAGLEEIAYYIEKIKLNLCHWFTVNDLVYLKRGGRVSPTVAFVGAVLGIKPVLHVDNEGKLINVSKVRGRNAALLSLLEKYKELSEENSPIFISHADCEEDAKKLSDMIKQETGAKVNLITNIGPVIGAHSGPGTLALFFLGRER